MIDTVLDHASLEAGSLPMQIEPVALAGVVDEVCTAARPRTRHRGNSLSADAVADVQVLADRTRLKQLLLALVSQANRGGDRLTILLFVRPPADGWVEVKVRDNGPGLAPTNCSVPSRPFTTRTAASRPRRATSVWTLRSRAASARAWAAALPPNRSPVAARASASSSVSRP